MRTKRIVIGLFIAAVVSSSAFSASGRKRGDWWNSYSRSVREGQLLLNAGAGINGNLGQGSDLDSYIPPFELSAEYTVKVGELPLGFGGFLGYTSYRTREEVVNTTVTRERNVFYIGAQANYHFNFLDELDLYGSLKTGLDFKNEEKIVRESGVVSYKEPDSWTYFHIGINAGATYYFSDNFGVNVEAGFPTILRIAASFKFKL